MAVSFALLVSAKKGNSNNNNNSHQAKVVGFIRLGVGAGSKNPPLLDRPDPNKKHALFPHPKLSCLSKLAPTQLTFAHSKATLFKLYSVRQQARQRNKMLCELKGKHRNAWLPWCWKQTTPEIGPEKWWPGKKSTKTLWKIPIVNHLLWLTQAHPDFGMRKGFLDTKKIGG